MKTIKLILCALVALSTVFVSCKKNNEELSPAKDIAKSYNGLISMSVSGRPVGDTTVVTVTLVATSNDYVTVKLPAVGEGRMALPALDVAKVQVNTTNDDKYMLAETSFEQTIDSVTFTGALRGTVANEKLTLSYSVKPDAMPMNIDFVFTPQDALGK